MTVFASAKHEGPSVETPSHHARPSSAHVEIPQVHERPEMNESKAKRPCIGERSEEDNLTLKKDEVAEEPRT